MLSLVIGYMLERGEGGAFSFLENSMHVISLCLCLSSLSFSPKSIIHQTSMSVKWISAIETITARSQFVPKTVNTRPNMPLLARPKHLHWKFARLIVTASKQKSLGWLLCLYSFAFPSSHQEASEAENGDRRSGSYTETICYLMI